MAKKNVKNSEKMKAEMTPKMEPAAPKKKIDKLTPKQEKLLVEWRDNWLKIGCSTERADRPRAEAAITSLYAKAGHKQPTFRWFQSPAAAVAAIGGAKFDSEMSLAQIKESAGKNWKKFVTAGRNANAFWGQQDSFWIAYYLFARDVLDVEYSADDNTLLDLWAEVAQSTGWWFPYEDTVFACERPTQVNLETDRQPPRIHSLTGPAVAFSDGWNIYAVRGMSVKAQVIEAPETLTPKEIRDENNAELRRVMLERYGFGKYLTAIGATELDKDTDIHGKPRRLLQAEIPGDEALTMVEVVNSSPEPDGSYKLYHLRVPNDMTTVAAAVAWTFDVPPDEYKTVFES